MRQFIFAGVLVVTFASCNGEDWSDPAIVEAAATDVQIVEAVLKYRVQFALPDESAQPRPLLVNTIRNLPWGFDQAESRTLGWGKAETWDSFFSAKMRPLRVPPGVRASFALMSEFALRMGIGFDGKWYGGGAGFPGNSAFYQFDSLVVRSDGKEAIVCCAFIWAAQSVDISVLRLVHDAGSWRVTDEKVVMSADPSRSPPKDPDRTY